mmetsp:Transcript_2490/g.7946  ORF Transcript_2490/g.7946 Transcript_2490/m.7946 type:complete len:242 (-) Transcript_2490:240-965(-)
MDSSPFSVRLTVPRAPTISPMSHRSTMRLNVPGFFASTRLTSRYSCIAPPSSSIDKNASLPNTLRALTLPHTASVTPSTSTPFSTDACIAWSCVAVCVRSKRYANGVMSAAVNASIFSMRIARTSSALDVLSAAFAFFAPALFCPPPPPFFCCCCGFFFGAGGVCFSASGFAAASNAASVALASFSAATPACTASSALVAPAALSARTFSPASATAAVAAAISSAVGAELPAAAARGAERE